MIHIVSSEYINNGSTSPDVTHWFVDCRFKALSLDFGRCHLGFLEPEVTIFGRESSTELAANAGAS